MYSGSYFFRSFSLLKVVAIVLCVLEGMRTTQVLPESEAVMKKQYTTREYVMQLLTEIGELTDRIIMKLIIADAAKKGGTRHVEGKRLISRLG
jgi:hypothetical protein